MRLWQTVDIVLFACWLLQLYDKWADDTDSLAAVGSLDLQQVSLPQVGCTLQIAFGKTAFMSCRLLQELSVLVLAELSAAVSYIVVLHELHKAGLYLCLCQVPPCVPAYSTGAGSLPSRHTQHCCRRSR